MKKKKKKQKKKTRVRKKESSSVFLHGRGTSASAKVNPLSLPTGEGREGKRKGKRFGSERRKKKRRSYGLGRQRERAVRSIFPQEGCRGAGLTVSKTSNASVPLTAAVRLSVSSWGWGANPSILQLEDFLLAVRKQRHLGGGREGGM